MDDSREKWITIDRLCDAYEASLQEGHTERAPFLAGVPSGWRDQLMHELDAIDAAYRDAKETREQTVTASPGEIGSRRLPKQSRLAELATLDSNKVWLGRFEIRKRLGTGATGSVWCARDARLARWVALKVPHATRVMSETNAARFQTEARAAAAISHPNVVQVHEVLIEDGLPILIQQWIDGPSLAKYMKEHGPLDFDLAADWMAQIADAVATAHECGIVHRDLKPANVMLDKNRPMVLDFGLASYPQLSNGLTSEGTVLGTPAYMSPEQAEGGDDGNKPPTDIYALGVILYEMLTGAPPFVGKAREVIQANKTNIPVPPRSRRAGIPRDLETITLRCLAKSPTGRYRTANDLRDDLIRFRKREPIKARKVSAIENVRVWMRLHPIATLLGTMVPLIVLLTIFLAVSQFRQHRLVDKLIEETVENRELVTEHHMVQLARASQEIKSGDRHRGLAMLREIPVAARNWEWQLLDMVSHSPAQSILNGKANKDFDAPINSLEVSHQRRFLFAASADGKVIRWKLPAHKPLFLKDPNKRPRFPKPEVLYAGVSEVTDLATSPNGKWLAWSNIDGDVFIWNLEENQLAQHLEQADQTNANTLAFSPKSNQLVVAGGNELGENVRPDWSSWITRYQLSKSGAFELAESYHWDRAAFTSLVFTGEDEIYCTRGSLTIPGELLEQRDIGMVQRWRLENGQLRSDKMIWRGTAMMGMDYHPLTRRVAWCDESGMVYVRCLDHDSNKSLCQFRVGEQALTQVRFAPSGRELAVTSLNGNVSRWNIGLPESSEPHSASQNLEGTSDEKAASSKTDNQSSQLAANQESSSESSLAATSSDTQRLANDQEPSAPTASTEIRPTLGVRHVKDYFGHESPVRDAAYLFPPILKPRELRQYFGTAYLVSCSDNGNIFQWGHENHQSIDAIELPSHGLLDAKWLSNDNIIAVSLNHRKSFQPGFQTHKLPSATIEHRSVKQVRQLSLPIANPQQSAANLIAIACADRIHIMRPGSGEPLQQLNIPDSRRSHFTTACVIDERYVVAGVTRLEKPVKSLSPQTPAELAKNRQISVLLYDLQHPDQPSERALESKSVITTAHFAPQANLLLIGTANGSFLSLPMRFPVMTADKPEQQSTLRQHWPNQTIRTHEGHRGGILDIESVDDDQLATVGRDGMCYLWNLTELRQQKFAPESTAIQTKLMVSAAPVNCVTANTDGSRLATASEDRMIRIWDTNSGLELVSIGPRKTRIMSIQFSPNSDKLLIADPTGYVEVIRLNGRPAGESENQK
ncbi:WD40 repeat domain-containing serine/threonine-protein kinase [Stieleria sp. JC731]|uniref:WD40 repeat domain-containing serine/threonine protein kinase n=1 Tax=Pirellulaceae TaxID=2691357 RepID=UPI001E28A577|nr:WD40 repeat domain-containing serine/threonine-protein kinase [Stieleria sp. JC731]MCC9600240.1 WD40 repeat domain-containing serine/threonine-protein kinase [Stieleria sp. JC731]